MKLLFYLPLLAVMTFLATSCSDDDDNYADPEGTVALNMLNQDNGKTLLGNSDVYIDNAYNFYGPSCLIADLGKRNGLGNISEPVFSGLATKVAVETGNGYQIFRKAAIHKFPSGKSALNIEGDYYNVYVVSQIKQNDAVVGANVKFALMNIPDYDLPEYNEHIGTLDHRYSDKIELTIDLPVSDFEYETAFASSSYYTLSHEKVGNTIVVRLIDYKESDVFGFYIRVNNSYTYVYGRVI